MGVEKMNLENLVQSVKEGAENPPENGDENTEKAPENGDGNTEKVPEETVVVVGNHFETLLKEMRDFLANDPHVKHLHLKVYDQKPDTVGQVSTRAIVYQGSLSATWLVLSRDRHHRVYKTSLLRAIKMLPPTHFLAIEFDNYDLSGGKRLL